MLIAVVAIFGVCYLPVHLLNILRYARARVMFGQGAIQFALIAHWLCYFNSAVNPVIYNFMSEKFRKAFKRTFSCAGDARQPPAFHAAADSPTKLLQQWRSYRSSSSWRARAAAVARELAGRTVDENDCADATPTRTAARRAAPPTRNRSRCRRSATGRDVTSSPSCDVIGRRRSDAGQNVAVTLERRQQFETVLLQDLTSHTAGHWDYIPCCCRRRRRRCRRCSIDSSAFSSINYVLLEIVPRSSPTSHARKGQLASVVQLLRHFALT
ncbi:hypothetical protein LSAT2_003342 [Lamellibrachia satsuma]|nr:hypothetical protein LSAT2_003342 [Lamellibrachia satsuma]